LERKIASKIYVPVNEAEGWRIRIKVEIKDVYHKGQIL